MHTPQVKEEGVPERFLELSLAPSNESADGTPKLAGFRLVPGSRGLLIGRKGAKGSGANPDLIVDFAAASRRHCRLDAEERCGRLCLVLRDFSTNGTFVDGVRRSDAVLEHGNRLALSDPKSKGPYCCWIVSLWEITAGTCRSTTSSLDSTAVVLDRGIEIANSRTQLLSFSVGSNNSKKAALISDTSKLPAATHGVCHTEEQTQWDDGGMRSSRSSKSDRSSSPSSKKGGAFVVNKQMSGYPTTSGSNDTAEQGNNHSRTTQRRWGKRNKPEAAKSLSEVGSRSCRDQAASDITDITAGMANIWLGDDGELDHGGNGIEGSEMQAASSDQEGDKKGTGLWSDLLTKKKELRVAEGVDKQAEMNLSTLATDVQDFWFRPAASAAGSVGAGVGRAEGTAGAEGAEGAEGGAGAAAQIAVVDTNELLNHLDCISHITSSFTGITIIIPLVVLAELENLQRSRNADGEDLKRALAARQALRFINSCMLKSAGDLCNAGHLPCQMVLQKPSEIRRDVMPEHPNADDQVLACAAYFGSVVAPGLTELLTSDKGLAVKALSWGVPCETAPALLSRGARVLAELGQS
eukprot:TRINITY_DN1999_c1_g1_i1.p1 TRINITY_DN1999_c1_g1~~TRINITY_DN1999_c1_g1_i1.p1  ORF type:complete len:580 (-),score=107.53 TRINITY_DN1999_c1_g1_i1:87-1826(-)